MQIAYGRTILEAQEEPTVYGFLVNLQLPSKLPQIRVKDRDSRLRKSHRMNTYYMNIVSGPLSVIETVWHEEVARRLWIKVGRLNIVPPSRIPALRLFQKYIREKAALIADNFDAFLERGELVDYSSLKKWQDERSRVMRGYLGKLFSRVSDLVSSVGRAVVLSALDRVIDEVFRLVGLNFTFTDIYNLATRKLRGYAEWSELTALVKTIRNWREKPRVKYFKLKSLGSVYAQVVTLLGYPDAAMMIQNVISEVVTNPVPSWRDSDLVRKVKELISFPEGIGEEDWDFGIRALGLMMRNLKNLDKRERRELLKMAIVRSYVYDTVNDAVFRGVIERLREKKLIGSLYDEAVSEAEKLLGEIRSRVGEYIRELRDALFSLPSDEREKVISFYRNVVEKLRNLRIDIIPVLLSREVNAAFIEEYGDDLSGEVSEMEALRRKVIETAEQTVSDVVDLVVEMLTVPPDEMVSRFHEFHSRALQLRDRLDDYSSMIRGGEISLRLREAKQIVDRVIAGNISELVEYVHTIEVGGFSRVREAIVTRARLVKH